jgi:hypothetical protein
LVERDLKLSDDTIIIKKERRHKNKTDYFFWELVGRMPDHTVEVRCRKSKKVIGSEKGPYETFTECRHSASRYLREISRDVVSMRLRKDDDAED